MELAFAGERLGTLALRLAQTSDLREVLAQVSAEVCSLLATPDCVIYLVEPGTESQILIQSAAWGVKNPKAGLVVEAPLRLALGEGIVGTAAASATAQLVRDTLADQRHVPDLGSGRSELAVPIIVQGEVIGVIDTEHPTPGHYGDAERVACEQIAALVGGQLHAAMAVDSLRASLATQAALTEDLRVAVMSDPLTGVANRRAFDLAFEERIASGSLFWACVIDLDHFKLINDMHGHGRGDKALVIVAQLLNTVLSQVPDTMVARIGGDEFGVLSSMSADQLHTLLDQLLNDIPRATDSIGHLSGSIGIAAGADSGVLGRADDALAVAKELGGNRIVAHSEATDRIAVLRERRSWSERTKQLLASNDLQLHYQPIMALDPKHGVSPLAYEALLRIDGNEGISTADFVDAATRYRLDTDLDLRLLHDILDVLQLQPAITIAQNWSARSFDSTSGLVTTLLGELDRRNLDPARLIIEITEHAAIDNVHAFQATLRQLRSNGIKIALDDLGAGWTSFKFLSETPVDYIKLDGEWSQQITTNAMAHELVVSTVRCAELTGAEVVAEWIETPSQFAALRDLGVKWGQGFFLSAPAALADHFAPAAASVPIVSSHRTGSDPIGR